MLTQNNVYLGSPYPIRDLLFVDDHVNGYINSIETTKNLQECRAINLCTGIGTSIKVLAEEIKKLTKFKGEIIWNIKNRPTEISVLKGDNTLAKEYLKWEPKYTLEEGLKIAAENIKKILGGENK
jgi:nucleoside-diphosphate-sugar epimerase